ncbi:hypothetical protein AB0G77_22585 [Streptomyces hygroscopicus]|uniref:hypothetical protein n=1 Tax=Streptomyces hygroscopicus TaxID=1912 RepID=UPI00341086A2
MTTAEQPPDVAGTDGARTERGPHSAVAAGLRYIQGWLRGHGAAGVVSLTEDVATAEIRRSQISAVGAQRRRAGGRREGHRRAGAPPGV